MRSLLLSCLLLPALAWAGESVPGPVPARVVRVIDGDTVVVQARIWVGQVVETAVRLEGIDAPERNGRCDAEKAKAEAARIALERLLAGGEVRLRDIRLGKYAGRVLARIETLEGVDAGTHLRSLGLARPQGRGRRVGWCDG